MESPAVDRWLLAMRLAAAGLLAAVIWAAARSSEPLASGVVFALACVATLVIAPIARAHYFVLLFPAVVILSAYLLQQGRKHAAIGFAVAPAVLSIAHYAWTDGFGRIGVLGLGITVWYVAACFTLLKTFPVKPQVEVLGEPATTRVQHAEHVAA